MGRAVGPLPVPYIVETPAVSAGKQLMLPGSNLARGTPGPDPIPQRVASLPGKRVAFNVTTPLLQVHDLPSKTVVCSFPIDYVGTVLL